MSMSESKRAKEGSASSAHSLSSISLGSPNNSISSRKSTADASVKSDHYQRWQRRRKIASRRRPRDPPPAAEDEIRARVLLGAAATLAVCAVNFLNFNFRGYFLPSSVDPPSFPRRSLEAEGRGADRLHLIPAAEPASDRDAAILWREPPFERAVDEYYSCLGKRLAGGASSPSARDYSDDGVSVDRDWIDSAAGMALDREGAASLIRSGRVDDLLVLTDRPVEAAQEFLSPDQRGRMMGLFAHPVENMWETLRRIKGGGVGVGVEGYKDEWREMGVLEWLDSLRDSELVKRTEERMVKKIVGKKPEEKATVEDLKVAMDFVSNYVVVGLKTEQEESLRRFNLAMGMKDKALDCDRVFPPSDSKSAPTILPNSPEWLALARKSPLDVLLHRHIERLFEEQYQKFEQFDDPSSPADASAVWWSEEFDSATVKSHLAPYDGPFGASLKPVPETPFFWSIPRTGGSHLQNLYWCLGLTLANQVGGDRRFRKVVPRHKLVEFAPWAEHGNRARVVNVDTSTRNGIVNAKNLGLLSSAHPSLPRPDVLFSPLFYYVTVILMSRRNRGRMFALFRDPVERAASRFESLKRTDAAWRDVPVERWAAEMAPGESNWMVRSLVGKAADDPVDLRDLDLAKVVVRSKFVVGLTDRYVESVRRFNVLLGVDESGGRAQECVRSHEAAHDAKKPSAKVDEASPTYVTLKSANFLDVMLYRYVEELFESQRELFEGDEAETE